MNMKKTIAAIAAGAMAVSAMASSVSAIELKDKVLSYNLAANYKVAQPGAVTITGSLSGIKLATGKNLGVLVTVPSGMKVKSITVTGNYEGDVTTPIPAYTRVSDNNADNYDPSVENNCVMIPIESSAGAGDAWLKADATTGATINVSAVVEHDKKQLFQINDIIESFGIMVAGDANMCYVNGYYYDADTSLTFNTGDTIHYFTTVDSTTKDTNGVRYMPNANNADIAEEVSVKRLVSSAFTASGDTVYKVPLKTGPKDNKNIAYYLQNGNIDNYTDSDSWKGAAVYAKTMNNDANYQNVLPVINDAIANYGTVTFTFTTAADSIAWTPLYGDDAFKKFYGASGTYDLKSGGGTYDGTYEDALTAVGGDEKKLVAVYDSRGWGADSSYKKFTQHLYNGTDNYYGAGVGWAGFASEGLNDNFGGLWGDNNLFGGALVINENLTMRLSDVDMPHICTEKNR